MKKAHRNDIAKTARRQGALARFRIMSQQEWLNTRALSPEDGSLADILVAGLYDQYVARKQAERAKLVALVG